MTTKATRDQQKRAVDFLVAVDRKPWFAVEVKKSKAAKKTHLHYFGEKLRVPFRYQVVWNLRESYAQDDVFVIAPHEFLSAVPVVARARPPA